VNTQVEELLRNARAADRIDRERAEMFVSMVKSPAWREYISLLEAKIQGFADVILAPSQSIDALLGLEYIKGAMSGLILARDLPSVTIAAMEQLRQERREDDQDDDEPAS
jgi:hypothetical protein